MLSGGDLLEPAPTRCPSPPTSYCSSGHKLRVARPRQTATSRDFHFRRTPVLPPMISSSRGIASENDLELEVILRRMGDYKDLVEMADLITACLSDDSEDVPDLPGPPCINSPGADSAGDAASVDADSSADAEVSSETVERSELVLQLIPTDAPWAIVFLSSFSAVTLCVGKTKL